MRVPTKMTNAIRQTTCGVLLFLATGLAWADVLYVHTDHLGTPRLATNEQGVTVWRNLPTTEPFGNAPVEEDPDGDSTLNTLNLRFPGQYADKETNLNYNYFRDYDPSTGRYVQSDPIGLAGGINTYTYVGANPLLFVDPDGLLACTYDIPSHTLSCTNNAGQSFSTNVTASGLGQCRDNPQCVGKPFKGPLPPGAYTIRPPGWSQRRPKWLYLDPDASNQMHKRGGFFIHPWGITNGCIILHIPDFNTVSGWAKQDGGGTLDVRD